MLRENLDDLDKNGLKGDWCFLNDGTQLALRYGDDPFTGLLILPIAAEVMPGKPHWQWDGDMEFPTLSPSILVNAYPGWNEGWHGFLRNGKLITV
jgi:hypothetical protein